MSRSRFAIWNYASALLFTGVTFLGLFVTHFVVTWLGEEKWEAARMVTNWVGFLAILDTGLMAALSPLLARAAASGDRRELEGYVSAGLRAYLGLLAVSVALALAAIPAIPRLIPVSSTLRGDLIGAWIAAVIGLGLMVVTPFRALADARQRGYKINLALAGQSLLIFGLSLAFARLGWGITGQVAAATLAVAPMAIYLTRDGLAAYPGLLRGAWSAPPSPEVRRTLARLGASTILVALSGRLGVLADTLIVGGVLASVATAARLDLTVRLTALAQGQLQGIGAACWAALAELHAQGRRDDFNRRLIELTGIVALLGVATLAPIAAYDRAFVGLWVGEAMYLGDLLIYVSAANALFLGLSSLWFWCFSGTGLVGKTLPAVVLGAVVNVGASVGLTFALGPIGPVLGTSASFATVSLWYLPLALRREFGTPLRPLFAAAARPLALGLPFAAALHYLARAYPPRGWFELGLAMATAAVAFLALGYRLLLGPTDRALWAQRLRSAVEPFLRRRGDGGMPAPTRVDTPGGSG